MQFLRKTDFEPFVRTDILDQVTEHQDSLLDTTEQAAIEEVSSYLRERFSPDVLFMAPEVYDDFRVYRKDERIKLEAEPYQALEDYIPGHQVEYNGDIYLNITATNMENPSNPVYWTFLGTDQALFYCLADQSEKAQRPTNSQVWAAGENRHPLMIMYLVDVVLYHLHSRINPRNVPELRDRRYREALDWLLKVGEGQVDGSLTIRKLEPQAENYLRSGSNIKQRHDY